jgi:N-acetylneuraminate lyase
MTTTFHGTWPALITPVSADGSVNFTVLKELVQYLLSKQVDGFYVCGATGEGMFMSVEERKQVLETVKQCVGERVPLVVHVGCVATRDAITLARHAAEVGVGGVSSLLPLLPNSAESARLHYTSIAAAAGKVPFFPYLYGGQVDAVTLMRDLAQRIPNIGGAKYTGSNLFELRQLLELAEQRWTIFSGMDEQCAFAAMFGAPGHIGSTLNLMPGVYRQLRQAIGQGDLVTARDLQLRANRITAALFSFGFFGALREAMRMLGFDCGDPRSPNLPVPEACREELRQALYAAGFNEMTALL